MSVEQKLTDKNVVTTTTTTNNTTLSSNSNSNSKPSNNKKNSHNSAKKIIKKALKTSKSKKTNKTAIANVNNNSNSGSSNNNNNTDISNKTAKSNNNNKSKNTNIEVDCGGNSSNSNNNNSNIEVPNDEIIEELFDFSDSDLKELDASNEENIKGNNSNNGISDISGEPGRQIEVGEMQKIIINDNHNNKEEQQQQLQVLDILSNESTDNIDKQTEEKEKNTEEENKIITKTSTNNASAESPSTLNLVSNGGNKTVSENNKTAEEKKSPKENDTNQQTINVLNTHCSMDAYDKTLPSPSSSSTLPDIKSMQTINESSGPEFISVNKESNHTTTTTDKNNADSDLLPEDGDGYGDDVDDDAGEYVEPYDELLVQFLDEANQIVSYPIKIKKKL